MNSVRWDLVQFTVWVWTSLECISTLQLFIHSWSQLFFKASSHQKSFIFLTFAIGGGCCHYSQKKPALTGQLHVYCITELGHWAWWCSLVRQLSHSLSGTFVAFSSNDWSGFAHLTSFSAAGLLLSLPLVIGLLWGKCKMKQSSPMEHIPL